MIGWRRCAGTEQGSTRGGMHGTRATGALAGAGHTRTDGAGRSGGLAGTRRTLIERLAGTRRGRTQRHSGARRGGAGHRRARVHMGRLLYARLMSQTRSQVGTRRNDGPGRRLANNRLRARSSRVGAGNLLAGRMRSSRILSQRLAGSGPGMTGGGRPGLAGACRGTRRRRNRHARAYALWRRRAGGRWRGGPVLLRRGQGLTRAGKDLAWPWCGRGNRSSRRRHGPQRRGCRRSEGQAWRHSVCGLMSGRRSGARTHRRMDRRAAAQHGRTQWNRARFVIVHVRLLLRCRLRVFGRCRRLAFRRGNGRSG